MRLLRRLFVVVVALMVVVLIAYVVTNGLQEKGTMDEAVRREAPGKFISLSDGVTHYQEFGPENGPKVLLIHGGGITGWEVWRNNVPFLVDKGYRVLAYDLYGRGYSDRPDIDYTPELLSRQLTELTEALHYTDSLDILSMSMGGMVALDYRHLHPERVNKLVFIAPSISGSYRASTLLKVPVVSNLLMTFYWYPRAVENQRKEFVDQELFNTYSERLRYFMDFKGYKHVNYSTWMHTLNQDRMGLFKESPAEKMLLIHGENDPYFPPQSISTYKDAQPALTTQQIGRAGHMPHFERPDEVNPVIYRFLEGR